MALDRPDILLEQGYPIMREAHARNRRVPLPGPRQFERWVASDSRRGAAWSSRPCATTACSPSTPTPPSTASPTAIRPTPTPQGRRYALTTGLFHAFATVVSHSPGVETLVDGLYARENRGLCHFKHVLGLRVAHLPAQVWFARPAASLLRYAVPHAYYRLTGRGLALKEQPYLACWPRSTLGAPADGRAARRPHGRDRTGREEPSHRVDPLAEQRPAGDQGEEGLEQLHLTDLRDAAARQAAVPEVETEELTYQGDVEERQPSRWARRRIDRRPP